MMSKEFIQDWCDFKGDKGYVLMAIARKSQNPELSNSEEIVHRRVLACEEDIGYCYGDLKALINHYDYTFRLYLTANSRSLTKAFYNFNSTLQDMSSQLYHGHDGVFDRLGRLGSEWKSEVHSPQVKNSDYFLYDLDNVSKDELLEFEDELRQYVDDLWWRIETPNGYHVLVEPFNYKQFEPPVEYDEFSTDGMVFVEEIK